MAMAEGSDSTETTAVQVEATVAEDGAAVPTATVVDNTGADDEEDTPAEPTPEEPTPAPVGVEAPSATVTPGATATVPVITEGGDDEEDLYAREPVYLSEAGDISISVGSKIALAYDDVDDYTLLKLEILSGEDNLIIVYPQGIYDCYSITAKQAGTTTLKFTYGDIEKTINIYIDGTDADQPLGEAYDHEVNLPAENIYGFDPDELTRLIIDDNNNLWDTYAQDIVERNVKDYVADWVYWGDYDSSDYVQYVLDTDDSLYSSTYLTDDTATSVKGDKLVDNVVRFDRRYALDEDGVLHNIYNSGDEKISDVKDWVNCVDIVHRSTTYILKNDGSLWYRDDVEDGQPLNEFKKLDDNVKAIFNYIYVDTDGVARYYYDTEDDTGIVINTPCAVDEIYEMDDDAQVIRAFYGVDGNFYYNCFVNDFSNFGNIGNGKDIDTWSSSVNVYALTEDGTVYIYDRLNETITLAIKNVEKMWYSYGNYSYVFELNDGTYCYEDGSKLEGNVFLEEEYGWPVIIDDKDNDYQGYITDDLVQYSDGSINLERNGIKILSNVKKIWGYLDEHQYALRTDGTVWDVTGVPKMLMDLTQSQTTGDVTGDGDTDIADLMRVLNHVSGKTTLTGNALSAGDVNGDGVIDLQDLMRILNFVSGKSKDL
jgi:hypothetical protein